MRYLHKSLITILPSGPGFVKEFPEIIGKSREIFVFFRLYESK